MADETTVEKHYCYPCNSDSNDSAMTAMLMNQNNAWNNNPFVYLVWMMMMRYMNGNGWGTDTQAENYNSRAIAQLQDTVNNNASTQTIMDALSNNQSAIRELAQSFNTDINTIQMALGGINSSIQSVAGAVGMSSESVKNAIALGDANIIQQMQSCCCSNKLLTQQMSYEGQLRDQANTSAITSRIDQLANGITQGFSQIGYATQAQTSEIIQAGNANTQKILDAMCNNTTQALRDAIADKDRQLQTQTLLNQLGGGCNCNS